MTAGRARLVALIVAGAFFMEFLDGTVIATALPAMARDFAVPTVSLSIGISAYLLMLAVFIPVSGWVADRYGTRSVFMSAIIVFTGASALCGVCDGLWPFVAARVLQGIGGAMMVPVGRLTVLRTTEKRDLVGAIALLTWPALAAPILGPVVGGFLTTYASWRWIFYINLPLGLAAIAMARAFVPNLMSTERRPFDLPGFVLSGVALAMFMEGLELTGQGGAPWLFAAGLLVGGLALGVVAVRHAQRAKAPMLDLWALRVPTFAAVLGGGSVFRLTISAVPFLLPLMFQVGFGLDAFHSGLLVLATFLGNLGMKPMTTAILRRWGFRNVGLVTGVLAALMLLACAMLYPSTPVALTVAVLFAGGLARSMQFSVLNTLAFADVPAARMSGASSLASVAQQMAIGMGVAVGAAGLHLAAAVRGGGALALVDFHVAFVMIGVLTLAGLPTFVRLPVEAGAEVSGHRV